MHGIVLTLIHSHIQGERIDKRLALERWQASLQIRREQKELENRKAKQWLKVQAWMGPDDGINDHYMTNWRDRYGSTTNQHSS